MLGAFLLSCPKALSCLSEECLLMCFRRIQGFCARPFLVSYSTPFQHVLQVLPQAPPASTCSLPGLATVLAFRAHDIYLDPNNYAKNYAPKHPINRAHKAICVHTHPKLWTLLRDPQRSLEGETCLYVSTRRS